jgi:hypothetical protein
MFDLRVYIPINDFYPLNQRQFLIECSKWIFQKYNDANAIFRGTIYTKGNHYIKKAWFYTRVRNHQHEIYVSTQLDPSACPNKQHELSKIYELYPESLIRCMSSQKRTLLTNNFTDENQRILFELSSPVNKLTSILNEYETFIKALPNQEEIILFKRRCLGESKELLNWLSPIQKKYPGAFATTQWESKEEVSRISYDLAFHEIVVKQSMVKFSLLEKYLKSEISDSQFATHKYTQDFINSFKKAESLGLINSKHREWVAYFNSKASQIK